MADLAAFAKVLDLEPAGERTLVLPAVHDQAPAFHSAGMLTAIVTYAAAQAFVDRTCARFTWPSWARRLPRSR